MSETKQPGISYLEDGGALLTLHAPVTIAGETITELRFRRPKGADLLGLSATPGFGELMDVGASICARPPSTIHMLDGFDARLVVQVVDHFLTESPTAGSEQ